MMRLRNIPSRGGGRAWRIRALVWAEARPTLFYELWAFGHVIRWHQAKAFGDFGVGVC